MTTLFRDRIISVLLLCLLILALGANAAHSQAAIASTWLDPSKVPAITAGKTISTDDYNQLLAQRNGFTSGQECIVKRIAIRSLLGINTKYYDGCWYNTSLGLLEGAGKYLLQPGTDVAGYIQGNARDNSRLVPTPNPNVFVELTDDAAVGHGSFIGFRLADTTFYRTVSLTGNVTLTYATSQKAQLATTSGNLHVENNYVWYSTDSNWMLVWTERGVLFRVNLQTFTVLSMFVRDKPSGTIPGMADISSSGRYVAVALTGKTFSELYVLDSLPCANKEAGWVVAAGFACPERMLKSALTPVIKPYNSIVLPQFYSDDTLGVYHDNGDTPRTYTQYVIQAPNTTASTSNYIALGDSFSSGEGVFDYEPGTDEDNNKCHLSKLSYPYLMNAQLNLTSFHSVACSGAKIEHVTNKIQYKDSNKPLGSWQPGAFRQLDLVKSSSADVLTISMSGNDIGFANKLKDCVVNDPNCLSTYNERKEVVDEINRQFDRLVDMYQKLAESSAPNGRIYVVGYPQIINPDKGVQCGLNVQLTDAQRDMATDLVSYFNAVIKSATKKAGVYYVGVEDAFNGHKLCEAASATTAVNGITAGNDNGPFGLKVIGNESFHPNQLGHILFSQAILQQTNNFTAPMPPKVSATIPNAESYPFLSMTKTDSGVAEAYNTGSAPDIATTKQALQVHVDNLSIPTLPDTVYTAVLHSNPITLGQIKSDGAGVISGSVQIPDTVPPGLHTLHLYGLGSDGKQLDIYQSLYVGVSLTDFDGDGISNEDEPCGVLPASGIDIDKDGIDDACDPIIGDPPAVIEEPEVVVTPLPDNPEIIPPVTVPETEQVVEVDSPQPATPVVVSNANFANSETIGAAGATMVQNSEQPQSPNVLGATTPTTTYTPSKSSLGAALPRAESSNHLRFIVPIVLMFLLLMFYARRSYAKKF